MKKKLKAPPVNSRLPKTMGHGSSLHRICPKLLIESSPSWIESQTAVHQAMLKLFGSSPIRLEYQTSVRRPTVKLFGSSPIRLESQAYVRRPTQKLFGSSPSRLKSQVSVLQLPLKLFGSSPSRLSFDRCRKCWLTSHPSVFILSQPLMTHVLDVYPPPVTETEMSPIFCTAQN